MYNYLNNKFNDSSKKVKIEIYLLTFTLCFSFILLTNEFVNTKTNKPINNIINKNPNKIFDKSFFDLIKNIEIYCKEKNIEIIQIENTNKTIKLSGNASISNVQNLVKKIENINKFSNIITFNLYKKNKTKKYNFQMNVNFEKFYIKKKNIDLSKTDKKTKTNSDLTLKLKAIISNEVLINNTWMKKYDVIKEYKLISINENIVVLEKKNKKIILKVYNDDKYSKLFN